MQNSLIGGLYLSLMFVLCFVTVYITKTVYILIMMLKPKPKIAENTPQKNPKKVYYIVEKKRTTPPKTTAQPKEIFFSNIDKF